MESSLPGPEPPTGTERYHFGPVVVDARAHTLTRDEQLQAVEPKAFAVLLALLRQAGDLVPRDQLLDTVWGHRHVTPGVLTRAIAQLRTALDDDSHQPRYIQTQHGLGYRFIAPLETPAATLAEAAGSGPETSPEAEPAQMLARSEEAPAADVDAAPAVAAAQARQEPVPRPAPVPRQRAASAEIVARRGRRASDGLPPAGPPSPRRRRGRLALWAGLLVLVTGMLVAAVLWWTLGRHAPPPWPATPSAAVLLFGRLGDERRERGAAGRCGRNRWALAGACALPTAALEQAAARAPDRRVAAAGPCRSWLRGWMVSTSLRPPLPLSER